MNFIRKGPSEIIPLVFDFRRRLGALAPGAAIESIDVLEASTPDGLTDLDIGTTGEALVDELSQLEVAVVARNGTSNKVYACTCRATVRHSGGDYVFDVILHVFVG